MPAPSGKTLDDLLLRVEKPLESAPPSRKNLHYIAHPSLIRWGIEFLGWVHEIEDNRKERGGLETSKRDSKKPEQEQPGNSQ